MLDAYSDFFNNDFCVLSGFFFFLFLEYPFNLEQADLKLSFLAFLVWAFFIFHFRYLRESLLSRGFYMLLESPLKGEEGTVDIRPLRGADPVRGKDLYTGLR